MKVIFVTERTQGGKYTVVNNPTDQIELVGLENNSSGLYEAFLNL